MTEKKLVTLRQMQSRQRGKVIEIQGGYGLTRRLSALGIRPGKKITKNYDLSSPEGVRGRNADLTLAKQVLGWKEMTSLEKGLEKTYHWIKMMVEKDRKAGS